MTYVYHILRDNPIAVYPLDSGATDVSGFNRDGSTTGTPTADRPLAARGIASQYLDTAGFTYPINDIMIATKERTSFSLEAWVKPHNATGLGNILARDTSGLFIDEGILFFQVASPSVTTRVMYEWLDIGKTAHIVGVYDTNEIYLYVNGEVVGSATVDDTVLDVGLSDTTTHFTTNSSGSYKMSVDTLAIYNYALSSDTINSHYSVGTSYPRAYDLSRGNGAHVYTMTADNANLKVALDIDSNEEWANASYTNCGSVDDELVNLIDPATGNYAAGVWEKVISFPDETGVIIAGSSLTWKASPGVLVYTALNDDAYVLLTNGGQPFSALDITTAQTLKIRIELPAGASQSVMKTMKFRAYKSKAVYGSDRDIPLTLSNEVTTELDVFGYNPVEFNDYGGMKVVSPASLSVAQDLNFGGYIAVEFTVFLSAAAISKTLFSAGTKTITTNGSGQWIPTNVTLVVDGVQISGATTVALNRWHHVVAIFTSEANSMTFLNGVNGRIGYLATYTSGMSTLNLAGAQNIYNNWVGTPALQVIDANVVTISEYDAKGYSYTWAIQPAG
jgi:hypothetical protein